jgi:hypothetical protein
MVILSAFFSWSTIEGKTKHTLMVKCSSWISRKLKKLGWTEQKAGLSSGMETGAGFYRGKNGPHCKKDYMQSKNCPEFICFWHENINSWALKLIFQAIEWKYFVIYYSTPLADIFHPVETYFPGHTLEML